MSSNSHAPVVDRFFELDGLIAASGFASGDRVVIGHWSDSPIGAFSDVMWAEPDGWRTLFVADDVSKTFITSIYAFDSVIVAPTLSVAWSPDDSLLEVSWPGARLEFSVGRAVPFPKRPTWVTQRVESPIAKRAMNVDTYGVSPTGVYEWYRTKKLRRIVSGWAIVAGQDLGEPGPPIPAVEFGFSEPPPFASLTEISPRLHDPEHRLDAVIDELRLARIESMAEFLSQHG